MFDYKSFYLVHLESRGFAFVRFYDKRDAEDAIEGMDGKDLDGRELRVDIARHDRPTPCKKYFLLYWSVITKIQHEEDIDQDQEVAIVEDLDQEIEDEDHEAVLVTVDVEVAQDRATVEEDPDQDLDPEIDREIDQEAALEEEADLEASPKDEVEAKRLLERRVAQDQDPNHEAGMFSDKITNLVNSSFASKTFLHLVFVGLKEVFYEAI